MGIFGDAQGYSYNGKEKSRDFSEYLKQIVPDVGCEKFQKY